MTDKPETIDLTAPAVEVLDRRALLKALTRAINETADRVTGERFRPREGDREKLQYLRALVALVTAYNGVIASTRDYRLDWLPPVPPSEREKRRRAASDARMEDLLDSLAGI